jgi:hypothetical protein
MRVTLSLIAPFIITVTVASGCAPAMTSMAMPNPARSSTNTTTEATQTYEVPPYREDHRYEATLGRWSPAGLDCRIHLVNADRCGLTSSYSFDLVDEAGRRFPLQATGPERALTAKGHMGATLNDTTVDGRFAIPPSTNARYVTLQVRPIADRGCTALDFRWQFQG